MKNEIKQSCKNLETFLTKEHMVLCASFTKSSIKENGMFDNMLDYIHIDKKWFFLIVDRDYH